MIRLQIPSLFPERLSSWFLCHLIRFEQPLALLGLWYLSSSLLHLGISAVSGIRYYVLAQLFTSRSYKWYGRWALVTVEADTLSYYYAEELAKKHMDIALIGVETEEESLKNFAAYLEENYNVTARVLCYNMDRGSDKLLECLQEEIEKLESIGVMVNQVPACPAPTPHALLSPCEESDELRVILLTTHLTKLVAHRMAQRRRGIIVNIGDPCGEYPHPYLAAHSASCAYMDIFSRSLRRELSCDNIYVQYLCPYPCTLGPDGRCTWTRMPLSLVAQHAVNGITKARSRGHWYFAVQGFLASCVPMCLRGYWRYLRTSPQCCSLQRFEK